MGGLHIAGDKVEILQDLIKSLYDRSFDEGLILDAAEKACSIVDSQYCGLVLYPSRSYKKLSLQSNNSPDYLPIYLSVKSKDYIVESLIETGRERVLTRLPDYLGPSHREFNGAVLTARPISDLIYIPIKINGAIRGHWSIARAGSSSPIYSDEEVSAFRFISHFLSAAFKRSLLPSPLEKDVAYLDYWGHILCAGDRIAEAFDDAFRSNTAALAFRSQYRRYRDNPYALGADRAKISFGLGSYDFVFSLRRTAESQFRQDDIPLNHEQYYSCIIRRSKSSVDPLSASAMTFPASTQEKASLVGTWLGELKVQSQSLRIVFNIAGEDGKLKATIDSPDQGAKGDLFSDGKRMTDTWTQRSTSLPLDLARQEAPFALSRPQDPKRTKTQEFDSRGPSSSWQFQCPSRP